MHLVDILPKDLQICKLQSALGSSNNENITPEIIVCCGLRFMGGEKIKSIIDIYGFSLSTGYRLVDKFLETVDELLHADLSIDLLPRTYEEKLKLAREWKELSSANGILDGHLGALDGWFVITNMPWDVTNLTDY